MSVAERVASRISAAVSQATGGADTGSAGEAAPAGQASAPEVNGAPAQTSNGTNGTLQEVSNMLEEGNGAGTPAADPIREQERAARRAEIEARLAEARERRRSAERIREMGEQAARDAAAAAAERQKWESLKQGSFKDAIAAMGRDPRATFEEMQREAIEHGTPEAEIKRARAEWEKAFQEKLAPLEETIKQLQTEREESRQREAALAAQNHQRVLEGAFLRDVQDPAFRTLRVEYDDEQLFQYVDHFDKNPQAFFEAARGYGVELTDPRRGFTMHEILTVLKKAQDAHDHGRQTRAARFEPPANAAPSAAKTPTVNGTAERRNAGQTIGNELAGERATPPRKLSRTERINREIERTRR